MGREREGRETRRDGQVKAESWQRVADKGEKGEGNCQTRRLPDEERMSDQGRPGETRRDCQTNQKTARRGVETAELGRAEETTRDRRRDSQRRCQREYETNRRRQELSAKEERDCQMRRAGEAAKGARETAGERN